MNKECSDKTASFAKIVLNALIRGLHISFRSSELQQRLALSVELTKYVPLSLNTFESRAIINVRF